MTIYHVPRGGKVVPAAVKVVDFKRPKENDPITRDRVLGVDTESLRNMQNQLNTVLVPYATEWSSVSQQEPISTDVDPISIMLDYCMRAFGEVIEDGRDSRVLHRLGKGTREKIDPILWVFYNLEYDLQRLFLGESNFFRFLRQGRTDVFVTVGRYKMQVVHCNATGSAPSFQIIVQEEGTRRVCRIYAMDMWGYWKTGLNDTAKSLGVGEKLVDNGDNSEGIDKSWFDIPIEEWTEEMWNKFTKYAAHDAELTRLVYLATAELLGSISRAVFNRVGMLPPSAPAAAARLAFSMASKEEWTRPARMYEQLALDAYHGGYVAMRQRGYVDNMTVIDLHSAYPAAMLLLPDPCTARMANLSPGSWTCIPDHVRKHNCMGFVRASFKVKQCAFPSISKNSKHYTLHQPGTYKNFAISLPELSALFDLGQIDSADIHAGFVMIGSSEESFLRKFVLYFYEIKAKEEEEDRKNSALYLVAKLLMNALYGKLIEIHMPKMPALEDSWYMHEYVYFPLGCKKPFSIASDVAQMYIDGGERAVIEWSDRNLQDHVKVGSPPDQIPKLMFFEILVDQRSTCGAYFLPIHASLITAMTRAKLVIMLNCFNATGGDTDSCFTRMQPMTREWLLAEEKANDMSLRAGCGIVKDCDELGGYGIEMIGGKGYVAGIKQYTLKAQGWKDKLAHHAITDPPIEPTDKRFKERYTSKTYKKRFCELAVRRLAMGKTVEYVTKKKPRRLREALLSGDNVYGIFVERSRVVTPKQDERLIVERVDSKCIHYMWQDIAHFDAQ